MPIDTGKAVFAEDAAQHEAANQNDEQAVDVTAVPIEDLPPPRYNNGDTPLVMAYIGDDTPHRGDSKAAIGLGKLVAEMVGGRYVYVDQAMLKKHFKDTRDIASQLKQYMEENGCPDIVIGTHSTTVRDLAAKPPTLIESQINESISARSSNARGLVSHHLTKELLGEKAREFDKRYPNIKGPLVAVMIGGYAYELRKSLKKISKIAAHYPDITFFVCPSRRTEALHYTRTVASLRKQSITSSFRRLFNRGSGVHVLSTSWKSAAQAYNPYLGLLGRADHIVILGDSGSICSEALFTEKTIYKDREGPTGLTAKGYVRYLEDLNNEKFPTVKIPLLDITKEVAENLTAEFQTKILEQQREEYVLMQQTATENTPTVQGVLPFPAPH